MSAFCPQCGTLLAVWGARSCSRCGWIDKPLRSVVEAAAAVLNAVDRNLDTGEEPFKWIAPWKELTALRRALQQFGVGTDSTSTKG